MQHLVGGGSYNTSMSTCSKNTYVVLEIAQFVSVMSKTVPRNVLWKSLNRPFSEYIISESSLIMDFLYPSCQLWRRLHIHCHFILCNTRDVVYEWQTLDLGILTGTLSSVDSKLVQGHFLSNNRMLIFTNGDLSLVFRIAINTTQ